MPASYPVVASIGVELTVLLTGTFLPAPSPRTAEDPDDSLEDIVIDGLLFETYEPPVSAGDDSVYARQIITHDILEGVDTSDPNVQLLLSNLLSCVQDDAAEALFEEVGE